MRSRAVRSCSPGSYPGGRRFKSCLRTHADVTQLVECNLAKVDVAGSSPVIRSDTSSMPGTLRELQPSLVPLLDPSSEIDPDTTVIATRAKLLWKCSENPDHPSYLLRLDHRANGSSCPICSGNKPWVGVDDLATTHPDLAAQWHPTKNGNLTPQDLKIGSLRKVWFQCLTCDASWRTRPSYTPRYCQRCKRAQGETLAKRYPEVASQWHPTKNDDLTPEYITYGSHHQAWWKCERGHEWVAQIKNRTLNRQGCPVCSGRRVAPGFNDLLTTTPELGPQWHPTRNHPFKPEDFTAGSDFIAWWVDPMCGHTWRARIVDRTRPTGGNCHVCSKQASQGERDLGRALALLVGDHAVEHRAKIGNIEVDLYIPRSNIAVEFNGLYWHSETRGKDRYYHANKTHACAEHDVRLIHVWEDDWRERRDLVVRGLAHRLGVTHGLLTDGVLLSPSPDLVERIGARKLKPVVLAHEAAAAFLYANHIQGAASGSLRVGLKDAHGSLRAVMVAKRTRQPGIWTIERYATRGIIAGGFTKLLGYARATAEGGVKKWVTFSDSSVSDGELYRSTGFTAEKMLPPDYSYVVGKSRVHKFNYRRERFKKDPDLTWVEDASETQLAQVNGLHRVWDTGKIRWVLTYV